ncbi:MAG: response regulator [Dehalococcoidia bacterium]|nr:response regulator [Dehalococcoidia bacterium]
MNNKEVTILITEDDEGHARLIQKNLRRSGITNEFIHLKDGQEALDFLFGNGDGISKLRRDSSYLMLLDIRMPKVDGVQVLERMKADEHLKRIPVIMLTTTDDPREIEHCHVLGCNSYVVKPVEYEGFVNAVHQLGLFLSVVEVPRINGNCSSN